MTRDEAFNIMKRPVGGEWEYDWIRRFVELGMLKLDEPEIVYSGPALAAIDAVIGNKFTSAVHVARALDAAGFKIVRKQP